MEVELAFNDVSELMDLGAAVRTAAAAESPGAITATVPFGGHLAPQDVWAGELKLAFGDLKSGLMGLLASGCVEESPIEMVGSRKRRGAWSNQEDDDTEGCRNGHADDTTRDVVAAKLGRVSDTLMLADIDDGADHLVDHAQDVILDMEEVYTSPTVSRSSWPGGDIGDNLSADLDSLGVDAYNISEAFLALPSLGVSKQEASSPASHDNGEAFLSLPSLAVFKQEAPSPSSFENGVSHLPAIAGGLNDATMAASSRLAVLQSSAQSSETQTRILHSHSTNLQQHSSNLFQQNAAAPVSGANTCQTESYPAVGTHGSMQTGEPSPASGNCRFQYVLAAATSIATKVTEETLTYLNQGQSYEIKLKKLGDLSDFRRKVLKSVIRICFHDRRLQYMEREQLTAWQASRPGERIVEVDVPLSYGVLEIAQDSNQLNAVEVLWDATKEVGIYIKVNCISTEFTPKKHGGEKGVPFRIQVETFLHGNTSGKRLHAAACQIKVFKLKGADRKHKQDREKILKRSLQEQDKYQPSSECTVLTDITSEAIAPPMVNPPAAASSPSAVAAPIVNDSKSNVLWLERDHTEWAQKRGGRTDEDLLYSDAAKKARLSLSRGSQTPAISGAGAVKNDQVPETAPAPPFISSIPSLAIEQPSNVLAAKSALQPLELTASNEQTASWLQSRRFGSYLNTFANFSASDLLRLTRDDLIQICGMADGIRLFNALHSKRAAPRLTVYVNIGGQSDIFHALYLDQLKSIEVAQGLAGLLGISVEQIAQVLLQGPGGIRVVVTDDVVQVMKNEAAFNVCRLPDGNGERSCLLMTPISM